MDANGILNVTASEKSTGKSDNITVTNDKGRLNKEDIEKMLADAEKFKEEDEKLRATIESRNGLENYVYQMKSTLNDEKVGGLLDTEVKDDLLKAVDEKITWLDNNRNASKEEYDSIMSEIQEKMKPIQEKMMENMQGMAQTGENMPKTSPSDETTHGSPKVIDIDDVDSLIHIFSFATITATY